MPKILGDAAGDQEEQGEELVGSALFGGLLVSVGVMLLGLILVLAGPAPVPSHPLPLSEEAHRLARGDPSAILDLGVLVLFFVPVLGVVLAMLHFVRQRDVAFVGVSAALLAVLIGGFLLALR